MLQFALYISSSAILVAHGMPTTRPAAYGSVRGSVTTSDDKPLEGATVFVLPAQDMRQQLRAQTDSNGKYLVTDIPLGEAYVSVFDEEQGYSYNIFSFFHMPSQEPRKVLLSAQNDNAEVNFKLGEKAARLQLEILDDAGAPITETAELVFTRADRRSRYTRGAGDNVSLLVPPVPFHLSINVPGFKEWTSGSKETGGMLLPKPNETIKITVHLVRAEK